MNTESSDITTPDFVGYENLITFLESREIHKMEGDLIEIGAFMGGGTAKLATYARKHGKKVYVIDVFEPSLDQTMSKSGVRACTVYEAFLEGRTMWEVYRETTRHFDNVITLRADSKTIRFEEAQKFVFGFIDGCHQTEYILNDFEIIWPHLVSGGVLGFHDYQYDDWPEVTIGVNRVLETHRQDIKDTIIVEGAFDIRSLLLIKK